MDKLLFTAPDGAVPEQGSSAYYLLASLETAGKYRDELCGELGGGFRADLQKLTGDCYLNWLIHSEIREFKGRRQAFYWLDERHLTCDWGSDKDARAIARKRYKDRSYYGRKSAAKGIRKAWKEKVEADREYQQRTESNKPPMN